MKTLWQKQGDTTDDRSFFHEFTTAEDRYWDHYLIPYDILVNIAQAMMLERIGVYSPEELQKVTGCLQKLYTEWEAGGFTLSEEDEDVHSATEKTLTDRVGDAGKRIHTGRSRNDQVLADVNLALKSEIRTLAASILEVITHLERIGKQQEGIFFAGMTHTQPAMPSSADAWCAGYIHLLLGDLQSLRHSYELIDTCPLGSAAGYGVPYIPVDREFIAEQLGFSGITTAVTAAQLTRTSSVLRVIHAMEYTALSFNRLASDVIEFLRLGIVDLADNQTSGSSIMPQKRNPDLWELIRSGYHRLSGAGRELSGIPANLTSGYHRDLQPVKAIVMKSLQQTQNLSRAVSFGLEGMSFNEFGCAETINSEVMATHYANNLVNHGVPFREAYRQTAAEIDKIPVEGNETIKQSYKHSGAPGTFPAADAINHTKKQIESWLHHEQQKWEKIEGGLVNR